MLGFKKKKKKKRKIGFDFNGYWVRIGGGRLGVSWVSQWISSLVIGHSTCLQGNSMALF